MPFDSYRAVSRYWENIGVSRMRCLQVSFKRLPCLASLQPTCSPTIPGSPWLCSTTLSFVPAIILCELVSTELLMPLSCCHNGRLQLLPARLALAKAAVISSAHRQQQLSPNHRLHSRIRQRRQLLVQSCNHSDKVMSQPRPGYRKNVGVCLVNQQGLVFAGR